MVGGASVLEDRAYVLGSGLRMSRWHCWNILSLPQQASTSFTLASQAEHHRFHPSDICKRSAPRTGQLCTGTAKVELVLCLETNWAL